MEREKPPSFRSGMILVVPALSRDPKPQTPMVIPKPSNSDFRYASSTASAPFTASALSVTVRSSAGACTEMFSAKNRASVT